MIAPAFIQDLLNRVDIVEVVGRHVALRKSGANHMGLCPFHGEKSPSFCVNAARQTYHCFGCGVHGNAIGFLMEHLGLGFIESVRDLAQQTGVQVPEDNRSPEMRRAHEESKAQRHSLSDVLTRASSHYRQQLKASARAIDYCKARGISGQVAAQYAMGYAPDGWRSLASAFPNYDDPLLEDSGLVVRSVESEGAEAKRYDRFRNRLMFPIRSVQGEVIGFGGRVIGSGEPKYLNSPETPVFSKGHELYGLYEARTAIRQRGFALVVEGYMDVIALAQYGIGNAVATLGTACTAEHVQKLFRFTDSVVFSFDGDAAGRRAASRAMEATLPYAQDTRTVRFLFLPSTHDPDSYVREFGAEGFEACIEQSPLLSKQLIAQAQDGCDLTTSEGRARLLSVARPMWASLPEGALKRQLLGDLAEVVRLDVSELSHLWSARGDRPREHHAAVSIPARAPLTRRPRQGAANLLDRALWLILRQPELWWSLDDSARDLLVEQTPPYAALVQAMERSLQEQGAMASTALIDELRKSISQDGIAAAALERICAFHDPEPGTQLQHQLALVIDHLRLREVDEELHLLFQSGIASPDAQQRSASLVRHRTQLKAAIAGATSVAP